MVDASGAVDLVARWLGEGTTESAEGSARSNTRRGRGEALLTDVLADPHGLSFALGFVDGVLRPRSLSAAASYLRGAANDAPGALPWHLRTAVQAGGAAAPALPMPVVPLARRAVRRLIGHLLLDARPDKLGAALARLRAEGHQLTLNVLGEAVLGEREARRRLDAVHALVRRADVDHVSVKLTAISSRVSLWAFEETVADLVERLTPLFLSAAATDTFVTLDMEEYRDLHLTVAVFTRLLEEPALASLRAGVVVQAYLPDALGVIDELSAWARTRVARGGAPLSIRLVKGANLPMERVDAVLHGWPVAPYSSKLDTDANFLRCLDALLTPERADAVHVAVGSHNLFDVAHARLLAVEREVERAVEFEMLLGMTPEHTAAVAREVGGVRLYVPVVDPAQFDAAVSYLARRLQENAAPENFLSAAGRMSDDLDLFARERDRYLASVARASDPAFGRTRHRRQDRTAAVAPPAAPLVREPAAPQEDGLTHAVLGIASEQTETPSVIFGGERFVETAVFSERETREVSGGAPGFRNAPTTDPSLVANREWARAVLARAADPADGPAALRSARIDDTERLHVVIEGVRRAAESWGSRTAAERSAVLAAAAIALENARGPLIQRAVSETGKVFAEADAEVSEAVDHAAYAAATARELDRVPGAVFVPDRVTLVTPPWNFPIAIPTAGVVASLAAGSGVVLKPAPEARRTAAAVAEALWAGGVPRDVLVLADVDEERLGEQLVTHPGIDRVVLTGSWETAERFRSWRPDLALQAETSGKNAIVVAPSADIDLAVADVVASAFGHAGQKCSAASLVILVGAMGRSKRFAAQLVDATRSLVVGAATDPRTDLGPLISAPRGAGRRALTTLDDGEQWLVEPTLVARPEGDELEGLLWKPGIRVGVARGSWFHRTEAFVPVLGVMHASSLAEAIEIQNEVAYGLTAGLHTRSADDLATWLGGVEAGNLAVNRRTTGAIVQRQPFGGWKRSRVGTGYKPGGPNHLIGLGHWRATSSGAGSSTLHLRGLDSRITSVIEAAQSSLDFASFEWLRRAALSDAVAWDREFGQVRDVSRLVAERNLFRYRPADAGIRATADAPLRAVLRTVLAAVRTGSRFDLSVPQGMPAGVRRVLGEAEVAVRVETDEEWLSRVAATAQAADPGDERRIRLVGGREEVAAAHRALAEAVAGDPDLAIFADEVTTASRIELLPFLREQSISITAHRFGTPDPWSESVI